MEKTPQELENIRVKYASTLSHKASEGEIQWNRYNAMLVVNTIIIGLIGLRYSKDYTFPDFFEILIYLIPLFGFQLCKVWYRMTERGFEWTKFWMKMANNLEQDLEGGENPVIRGKEKSERMGVGVTKKFSLQIINVFSVIYIFIFVFNLYQYFRTAKIFNMSQIDIFILLVGLLFSLFYGYNAVYIFQRTNKNTDYSKYNYVRSWWIHQFWINFLGSMVGWLGIYYVVHFQIWTDGVSWEELLLVAVSLIGVSGAMPRLLFSASLGLGK